MRTGSRRRRARGLGYFGLLMLLALLGATLGEAGTVWRTAAQREREAELRFRGEQIRSAIQRYREAGATPGRAERAWPPSLEALLEDRRGGRVRHHLRRLWTDPFTGAADWVLLPAPGASGTPGTPGIAGVRSRSDAQRLSDPHTAPRGASPAVSDWHFVIAAGARPEPGKNTLGRTAP